MEDILLDRNENRYGPAPACLERLREVTAETLSFYPREFKRGRYSLLSGHLADLHCVDEQRVVLGYGAEDVLKQALNHYLAPGERCFVPATSWWYYRALVEEANGKLVEYPINEHPTTWRYDVDALLELNRRQPAKLAILSTPNNPTGNSFPAERLRETLDELQNAVVLIDEAYFGFTEPYALDAVRFCNAYPNVIVLRSFSKLYGLAGARIGYALVSAELKSFLQFTARYLGYCRVSEQIALAALEERSYYRDVRRKIARDRVRLCHTLRGHEGVRAYDSDGNFVLARFPGEVVAPLRAGLEARGIIVKFLDEPGFANCARITVGTQSETTMLCNRFDELLPSLLRRVA